MGHDDELRPVLDQLVDRAQRRQLAVGRQRRLGFVQQVQAVTLELVEQDAHERLAVRARMQVAAIAARADLLVHIGRDVIEAFGAHEIAVPGSQHAARHAQVPGQRRPFAHSIEQLNGHGAALDPEAQRQRDRFQDGRLAAAVLADEEGHVGVELDRLQFAHGRDVEREAVKDNLVAKVGPDALQIGFGGEFIHGSMADVVPDESPYFAALNSASSRSLVPGIRSSFG